jgi:hypothetical protein
MILASTLQEVDAKVEQYQLVSIDFRNPIL